MKSDDKDILLQYVQTIREPDDLFAGRRLPRDFKLPDNILAFFHNFTAPTPNSHGRCTIVIPFDPMTYYVERNICKMDRGSLLYVSPHKMRFLHPGSKGYRRLFITFDPPGKQDYLPQAGVTNMSENSEKALLQFLSLYHNATVEKCAIALMDFLLTLRSEITFSPSESSLSAPVIKTISYIETHLHIPFVIKNLAEQSEVSESHLRMLFRREMGISLGKFIAHRRLELAKYYLIHSGKPIAQVASGCGFSSVFAFSSFFKKYTCVPPAKFRNDSLPT